eukprot:COSAG04_NODE_464_length_13939_cov_11.061922_5_plen_211_part_00
MFFTRATLYLGLLDAFLASPQFSDYSTDTQQSYLNLLSGIVPLGCLFAPVIDPLIKRLGFLCYALWVAVTGAAYTALMLVPSMHVQLLGCVFFTYYRANVFAFPGIYNITVFGGRTVGTVQGLMFTLSAPLNYLSSPALTMTQSHYHGDFVRPRRSCSLLFVAHHLLAARRVQGPLIYIQLVVVVPVVLLALVMMCTTVEAGMMPQRGEE